MFSQRREFGLVFLFLSLSSFLLQCNCQYPPSVTCNRLECAPYQVIHSQNEFEIRTYNKSLWVSSPALESDTYRSAAAQGFRLLFNYFRGNNTERVNITMTAPVLIDVQETDFTVHFYVPQEYQHGKKLPTPTEEVIKVVELPRQKYAAVRRFDGFINDQTIAGGIAALRTALQGTPFQAAAQPGYFSVAGYSSPRRTENRVNEVIIWFDT